MQGGGSTYEFTNPITGEKTLVRGRATNGWELYTFEEGPDPLSAVRKPGVIQVFAYGQSGTRVFIQSENDQGIAIYLSDADGDGVFDQLDYSAGPNTRVFDYKADGQPDVMTVGGTTSIRIGGAWYPYFPVDQDGRRFALIESERREVQLRDGVWAVIE